MSRDPDGRGPGRPGSFEGHQPRLSQRGPAMISGAQYVTARFAEFQAQAEQLAQGVARGEAAVVSACRSLGQLLEEFTREARVPPSHLGRRSGIVRCQAEAINRAAPDSIT